MLMLLSVHMTSVLLLVWFSNFALTYGLLLHGLTLVARSYALLVLYSSMPMHWLQVLQHLFMQSEATCLEVLSFSWGCPVKNSRSGSDIVCTQSIA